RESRSGCMAKQQKGPGIQSAAGLIRYFDAEEETAVKIPPAFVLVFGIVVGLGVLVLTKFWNY
ncbi:MAG TPA: preprotein translocase subunit Sec61beta, partial [Candidatus Thermoplasmatota archaeon]|nr:preprotein translocase subunit Sec61beta [Candidatus Thermoplasmatota archaeon]